MAAVQPSSGSGQRAGRYRSDNGYLLSCKLFLSRNLSLDLSSLFVLSLAFTYIEMADVNEPAINEGSLLPDLVPIITSGRGRAPLIKSCKVNGTFLRKI